MPDHVGVLVVDNSCLRALASEDARRRFERNTRAARWQAAPSAVNLLEVLQNDSAWGRERDLRTLRWLAQEQGGFLPWPEVWLKESAEALTRGDTRWYSSPSGLEVLLEPGFEPDAAFLENARRILRDRTAQFDKMHEKGRPIIQDFLRERGLRGSWDGVPAFLEEVWMEPSHLDDAMEGLWRHLDMDGLAPVSELREIEVWRIFFEMHGLAVYERAVMVNQRRMIHLPDLFQLLYLAGSRRRTLATADGPFLRGAHELLAGRYENATATTIDGFVNE